jgi:hypothetical protein
MQTIQSRYMRKWTISLALGLLAMLVLATPALAGRGWCARDPIVALNGADLQVWVAVPEEYQYLVTGPIDVEFNTPAGVERGIVFVDEGFNGYGETIRFSDHLNRRVSSQGEFTVRITASVSIDEALARRNIDAQRVPLRITIIENGQTRVVSGMNTGTTIETRIEGIS